MAEVIKAPAPYANDPNKVRVFLGGSIEMGKAVDWQADVTKAIESLGYDTIILNPRRDDWDSSWEQDVLNDQFRGQVCWEQDALLAADLIIFYFAPDTMSPITLMEFGQFVGSNKRVLAYCPEGFWRKGNVDIVAMRNGHRPHNDYNLFIQHLKMIVVEMTLKKGLAKIN